MTNPRQLNKNDILDFLRENRVVLRDQFRITEIGLFGSFARDEQNSSSDIDLLFELEENTNEIHELKQEIKDYFKSQFERNVDLARIKFLKPFVKEKIFKEAIYVD